MYSHTFTFDDGRPFTTGCTSVVTATLEGSGACQRCLALMLQQLMLVGIGWGTLGKEESGGLGAASSLFVVARTKGLIYC